MALKNSIASERGLLIWRNLMRTLNDYFISAKIADISKEGGTELEYKSAKER